MKILELAQELAEMTTLVDDDDIETSLGRFVARVVRTVPDCDYATITVSSSQAAKTLAGCGTDDLAIFDNHPRAIGELGPIGEALLFAEPRRLTDIEIDDRWPLFNAGLRENGYRSCMALPLNVKQAQDGAAFGLFSKKPNAFDETTFDLVLLFTLNAGVVFDNASLYQDSRKLVDQLRTALASQRIIGQAQGILMREYAISSEAAFEMLKHQSQHRNIKLRLIARELVDQYAASSLPPT